MTCRRFSSLCYRIRFSPCQLSFFAIRGKHSAHLLSALYPGSMPPDADFSFAIFNKPTPQHPYYAPEYYSSDTDMRPPPRVYFPPRQQFGGHRHSDAAQQPDVASSPLDLPQKGFLSWLLESHSSVQFPSIVIPRRTCSWGGKSEGFDVLLPQNAAKPFWSGVCRTNALIVSKF